MQIREKNEEGMLLAARARPSHIATLGKERDCSQSSAEEEIHRGVYASVVRTGKGNMRKNAHAARKSRKQLTLAKFQVNNTVVFSRRC